MTSSLSYVCCGMYWVNISGKFTMTTQYQYYSTTLEY